MLNCVNFALYYVSLFQYCTNWYCTVFMLYNLTLCYLIFHHFNVAQCDAALFNVALSWYQTIWTFFFLSARNLSFKIMWKTIKMNTEWVKTSVHVYIVPQMCVSVLWIGYTTWNLKRWSMNGGNSLCFCRLIRCSFLVK